MTKKILILIFMFAFILLGYRYSPKAKAAITTNNDITIEGVQIRTTGNAGMRFAGKITEAFKTSLGSGEVKFGVVFAFGEVDDLSLFKAGAQINGKQVLTGEVNEVDSQNKFYITLVNIPQKHYMQKVTVRAYVLKDGSYTYSTNHIVRNLGAVSLLSKNDGYSEAGNIIDIVSNIVETSYRKVTLSESSISINNDIYELDPGKLKTLFVTDYNKLFSTTLPLEFTVNEFYNSARSSDMYNLSASKLYQFFNDADMKVKWGWLLNFLKSVDATLHTSRQIVGVQGNGTNGSYKLYYGDHLICSIYNFFNRAHQVKGYTAINFTNNNMYNKLKNYNTKIYQDINSETMIKIGDTYTLPNGTLKPGFDFLGWQLNGTDYQPGDTITVTANSININAVYTASKAEVQVSFDLQGQRGSRKYLDLTAPLATVEITRAFTADTQGHEIAIKSELQNDWWHHIALQKIDMKGVYKIIDVGGRLSDLQDTQSQTDYYIQYHDACTSPFKNTLAPFKNTSALNTLVTLENLPGNTTTNTKIIAKFYPSNSLSTNKTKTFKYDAPLPDAYQENKYFLGWQINGSGSPVKKYTAYATDPGNLTLTPVWENNTTGRKDLRGGIATGYLYTDYSHVTEEFYETLDIIYTSFAKVDSNGNISSSGLSQMDAIIQKAHTHGTRVIVSFQGVTNAHTNFSDVASDPTKIDLFATNIVNLINTKGFDGVDIDWETPTSSEKTNYTALMKAIYEKVKANNPNHLVTTAIAGGVWQPKLYDLENSIQYLDYVNMMAYDFSNNSGQYQNALFKSSSFNDSTHKVGKTLYSASIDESVTIYNNYSIPNNKIIIGTAFYGRAQQYDGTEWKKHKAWSYTYIKNTLIPSGNYNYVYDEVAQVPYLLKTDGTIFVSYDDPRSVERKCQYVHEKSLAGVMYWQDGQDRTGDLLKAIRKIMD